MSMIQFYAYVHIRPSGEPFHVGKGSGRRAYEFYKDRNKYYHNVVHKHGADRIKVRVYMCLSEQCALEKERALIKRYRRLGYRLTNMTDGGDGVSGYRHTPKARKKFSKRMSGTGNPFYGKKHSAKTRKIIKQTHWSRSDDAENIKERLRLAQKGRVLSVATKAKISIAVSGAKAPFLGKHHSKAAKLKMSIARKKRITKPETRAKLSAIMIGNKRLLGHVPWNKGLKMQRSVTEEKEVML